MRYKTIPLRLPPDIHDVLTRLRTERHVNISAWVRAAIKSALEHEGMLIGTGAPHTPSRLQARSQDGGPTAWTMATGAPSTSAIPPGCPLSLSV